MDKLVTSSVSKLINAAEEGVKTVEKTMESVATPARKSLLKRFPILFALLVTTGVSIILLGIERVIENIPVVYNHPTLMLGIGVGILVGTGTLYKKLG